jgi:hypothetical protein
MNVWLRCSRFILPSGCSVSTRHIPTQLSPRFTKPVLTPGQTLIAEAHALVNAMNLGDVGMTGNSAGRHTLLARKQERLHCEINQAWRDGVNSQVILQRTKDDIKTFGSSSIR